ncbi:hypothetical protein H0H87_006384, partial [Tephrocybe sp. NHM501043]
MDQAHQLNLASLSSLKTLRLSIERKEIPAAVKYAGDLLKTIPTNSSVHNVNFRLVGFPSTRTPLGDWARIDTTLTDVTFVPELRHVAIYFVVGIFQKDNWLSKDLSAQMSKLRSKNMVSFSKE